MNKFFYALVCFCLPIYAIADEIPAYPASNPTAANVAAYYQALSEYYQKQAKTYADKAKLELAAEQKKKNLAPAAIKNPKPFVGSNAGLGLVVNTGDSSSQNFNGNALLSYTPTKASTTLWNITYQNNHDNNKGQLSNNFYTDLNSAYNFDGKNGIYGDANYTRNTFSGYSYQSNESIGYNRVLYDNSIFSLTGQIGPGLQQSLASNPALFQNQIAANIKIFCVYNFSEQSNWRETYTLISTASNTLNILDSAVSLIIADPFALQLDYLINYNTNPQPDKFKLNTMTTLSLVYNF